MVTLTHADDFRAPRRSNLLQTLRAEWVRVQRQREDRRALARVGRLGPQLLADMGLSPEEVRAALGGWDDLRPNGFLVHRRQ